MIFRVTRALTAYETIIVCAGSTEEARYKAEVEPERWDESVEAGFGDDPEIIDIREDTPVNHAEELRKLAARPVPPIAAKTAAAEVERGYGYNAPSELREVLSALDAWVAGGRPDGPVQPGDAAHPYGRLVTALTVYDIAIRRSFEH